MKLSRTDDGGAVITAYADHLLKIKVQQLGIINATYYSVTRAVISDGFVWIENGEDQVAYNINDVRNISEVKLGENK